MALTLDATIGGASSNSYATRAQGDAYHEGHVSEAVWSALTDAAKDRALVHATSVLDYHFRWSGAINSTTQALLWPRIGLTDRRDVAIEGTELPSDLIDATAELARQLSASDRTADMSQQAEGIKRLRADVVEVEFDQPTPMVIPDAVYHIIPEWWYFSIATRHSMTVPLVRT